MPVAGVEKEPRTIPGVKLVLALRRVFQEVIRVMNADLRVKLERVQPLLSPGTERSSR
jgi:hypothetical protein